MSQLIRWKRKGICDNMGHSKFKAPSSSLVRTSASQAENTGSNPVGAIKNQSRAKAHD